jgi:hypothetical protein
MMNKSYRIRIIELCGRLLCGGLIFFALGLSPAKAAYEDGVLPELKIEGSATIDAYNKYLWRGFTLDTDGVVQPGVSLSGYGLSLLYWSSFDASNKDALSSDEVDLTVDYTYAFENISVSAGHTTYNFPGSGLRSKEWYVGLGLPKILLSPILKVYNDYGKESVGGGDGQYVNLGVSYSTPVISAPEISLDLAASVGFNDKLFIKGNGGDYLLGAGLTIPLTKNTTLSPKFGYAVPFGDLKDAADGNQKSRTFCGVSIVAGF